MNLREFQSREEVRVALSLVERVAPPLAPLRDGAIIGGNVCRLTVGTLCLLQVAQNEIFFANDINKEHPVEEYEFFEALWLCSEDNVDTAVWITDDPERLEAEVKSFMRGFRKKARARICAEFSSWVEEQVRALEQASKEGDEDTQLPSDWWVDSVDVLAFQYHWPEDYIMWKLPLVRALKYQEAINDRLEGKERSTDISPEAIDALKLLEKEKENGKS